MFRRGDTTLLLRTTAIIVIATAAVLSGIYTSGYVYGKLNEPETPAATGSDFDEDDLQGLFQTGQIGPQVEKPKSADDGRYKTNTAGLDQLLEYEN